MKTSMSRVHAVNSKNRHSYPAIPSWKGMILNRGRGPSRSREARRRETLTGGRDSLGLSGEGMAGVLAGCASSFRALAQLPSAL